MNQNREVLLIIRKNQRVVSPKVEASIEELETEKLQRVIVTRRKREVAKIKTGAKRRNAPEQKIEIENEIKLEKRIGEEISIGKILVSRTCGI